MSHEDSSRRTERGQTLVVVALAMVALLGMSALIVDGGNAFAQQRGSQNGSDAASEAGATVLAHGQLALASGGAGKTDAELAYALDVHVGQINAESADELLVLNKLAGERGLRQRVALRLNPGVDPHAQHKHISTGHAGSKFGIEIDEAEFILNNRGQFQHLDLAALHVHIGSQIHDPVPLAQTLERILPLAQTHAIRALDIGGGFPVAYRNGELVTPPEEFARAVHSRLKGESRSFEIAIEPGRFIVADAGVLVAQVQATKHSYGRWIVVTDAGMTDLIRPALYEAYHEILPVVQGLPVGELADVAGPICESSDFLGKERSLPRFETGELLAVMSAGAYGHTMSSNYNARPRAPEVMVRGDRYDVVRDRETYEDLLRGERMLDPLA